MRRLVRKWVGDLPPGTGKKLAWISVLYFAEGFPFGIAYDVWPVYFRVHGVSLREIGLMALLFLPYTLKPAWAPFVDRFGTRQAWIAACQLALGATTVWLLFLEPSRTDWLLWASLLVFMALSATQDISIDAYAVDVATPRDSGYVNGFRVAFYRAALLFASSVLLILADLPAVGWSGVWVISAVIFAALALMALASPRVPRERAGVGVALESIRGLASYRGALLAATGALVVLAYRSDWRTLWVTLAVIAGTGAIVSFLSPELLRWAVRREMLPVVAFILLYKVGDSTLGRMVKPFWVDKGMSTTEIGVVSSGLGMGLTIAGALLGGVFVARRGIFQALLWMGLAQLVSNFGYVAVAALNLPRGEMAFLGLSFGPFQASIYLASIVESITQGLGTAAFLSFLMNICDRAHAATQYALLSAGFSLSRDVAGAFSGIGVEALGYPTYFTFTAFLALPGLLLLPLIKSRIREDGEGEAGATVTEAGTD